jgi:flagellar basal body-associated protein FliL
MRRCPKQKGGREMKVLKITGKTLLIIVVIAVIILMAVLLFLAFYPGVGKTPDKQMQRGLPKKQISFMTVNFTTKTNSA